MGREGQRKKLCQAEPDNDMLFTSASCQLCLVTEKLLLQSEPNRFGRLGDNNGRGDHLDQILGTRYCLFISLVRIASGSHLF